jgi:hypothetical protein
MEEPSLEDQVSLWKDDSLRPEDIQGIILKKSKPSVQISDHVFQDIEFFETHDGGKNSVFSTLSNTQTPYGKYVLRDMLASPTIDTNIIQNRQWIIDYFMKNKKFSQDIKHTLNEIKNPDKIFWLWKETDKSSQLLFDIVYYQVPVIGDLINSSEIILAGSTFYSIFVAPAFSLMTPVLCFILPYIMLRYMGLKISFLQVFKLLKNRVFSVGFIPGKTASMAILSAVVWFAMYFYNFKKNEDANYKISRKV